MKEILETSAGQSGVDDSRNGPFSNGFNTLVAETLESYKIPGLSIAVLDGANSWTKGYGFAELPSKPVTSETLFFAGSTTKAFTAATLSLLVDDNEKYPEVQLQTPVSQLIRNDFVLEDEWATNHLTIEDILSHRTGMPHHDQAHGRWPTKDEPKDKPRSAVRDTVRLLRHLPLTAEPRTKYQYCNLMYIAASHVIETLTGTWLGKVIADRIWRPLNMHMTYFSTEDAASAKQDLAKGYYYDEEESCYKEVPWMDLDGTSGAGSVISNVIDYSKWARAVMEKTGPISAWDELTRPRTLMPLQEPYTGSRAYALGWRVGVYAGHEFLEHTGGMDAFGTMLIIFPDIRFSVIAFANTAGSSNMAEQVLAYHLIDEKLGVPEEKRYPWDKKNKEFIKKGKENASKARQTLYPEIPQPPLPLCLPLSSYAGDYHHPGYQTLTIYLDTKTETLRADRDSVSLPEHMAFEHVSQDFFLIRSHFNADYGAFWPAIYAAEFRVGADGKVTQVGIAWEEEMAGEKIWLDRQ